MSIFYPLLSLLAMEKASASLEKVSAAMGKLEEAKHILTVPELEIEKVRGRGDAFLNSGIEFCAALHSIEQSWKSVFETAMA